MITFDPYTYMRNQCNRLDIAGIFKENAELLGLELSDVLSKCRKRELVDCRRISIMQCIDIFNEELEYERLFGFTLIANFLGIKGDSGHSNMIHTYNTANTLISIKNREFIMKVKHCQTTFDYFRNKFKQSIYADQFLKRDEFHVES